MTLNAQLVMLPVPDSVQCASCSRFVRYVVESSKDGHFQQLEAKW